MSFCARLPWLVAQQEAELLFCAWPVPPAVLAPRLPAPLTLDLFEHQAWITIIPFEMRGLRLRLTPPLPFVSAFPELDVVTCVRHGDTPGIWFFRIEAATWLGALLGPALFGLPYHQARLAFTRDGEWRQLQSQPDGSSPSFGVRYRPLGQAAPAAPGTLEAFICERFTMFSRPRRGTMLQGREARLPRQLQPAEVALDLDPVLAAVGLPSPPTAPVAWYCAESDLHTWLPAPVTTTPGR